VCGGSYDFSWASRSKWSSTEQRKRLTIAVELVANPCIIFMDEPTSGLDARAAAIVMRTVRNTVDAGRTVVCTIHQPSIDIFEAFDELLLMRRGGQVIYAGPLGHHSNQLVEYFQMLPGVTRIKDGQNLATWMLEVSSPTVEAQIGVYFATIYATSEIFRRNQELIKELSTLAPGSQDLHFATTSRQQDLMNMLGALYAAVMFLGGTNTSSVQTVFSVEDSFLSRESSRDVFSPPQIPIWWRWYYWALWLLGRYTGLFGQNENLVEVPGAGSVPLKEFIKSYMGFEYDFLHYVAMAHFAWLLCSLLCLHAVSNFLTFNKDSIYRECEDIGASAVLRY
ncbi:pleiotropic drug resistance protein 2-like protein isoform X2, partial [Tanacetum coccineum]